MSMFVILREKPGAVFDDALMDIYELAGFVESETADLASIRKEFGDGLLIAEEITMDFEKCRTAIPGELDRAITEWNAMTDRINIHIDKVKERSRFVAPYRKWVKAAGHRDYLLEQLVADVEAQPYIWPTIRFGWLLRSARTKDGELNSEKIHARAYGKGGNGNGQITEATFLALAKNISRWKQTIPDYSEETYAQVFEATHGISTERWRELRERFNGAGANAEV